MTKKKWKRNANRRAVQPPHLRIRRPLSEGARLSAFHRGSCQGEFFIPMAPASGQASWDAVRAGVTRLRLSQSRVAPPTPVIVPEGMMPEPPGNGVYGPAAGTALAPPAESTLPDGVRNLDEMAGYVTVIRTDVKGVVAKNMSTIGRAVLI